MVVAKACATAACLVARAEGSALAPTWAGAVEPPAKTPTGRLKGRNVNAEGKPYAGNPHVRFDEGLLARALRTAGWGLLHHRRRRLRPSRSGRLRTYVRCSLGAGFSPRRR